MTSDEVRKRVAELFNEGRTECVVEHIRDIHSVEDNLIKAKRIIKDNPSVCLMRISTHPNKDMRVSCDEVLEQFLTTDDEGFNKEARVLMLAAFEIE